MRKLSDPASEVPLPGFEQFQDEFLATRRTELVVLKNALKDLNFSVLSEQAHKWRGFSAPYGFQELGQLAEKLESYALSAEAQSCEDLLKKVEDYLGTD